MPTWNTKRSQHVIFHISTWKDPIYSCTGWGRCARNVFFHLHSIWTHRLVKIVIKTTTTTIIFHYYHRTSEEASSPGNSGMQRRRHSQRRTFQANNVFKDAKQVDFKYEPVEGWITDMSTCKTSTGWLSYTERTWRRKSKDASSILINRSTKEQEQERWEMTKKNDESREQDKMMVQKKHTQKRTNLCVNFLWNHPEVISYTFSGQNISSTHSLRMHLNTPWCTLTCSPGSKLFFTLLLSVEQVCLFIIIIILYTVF